LHGAISQDLELWITKEAIFNLNNYTADSFKPFFTEPFESCVAVLKDGKCIIITEQSDYFIKSLSWDIFIRAVEMCGCKIQDVAIIVHNHARPTRFSFSDTKFYYLLSQKGFNGRFLIYYPFNNSVREHKKFKDKRD